MAHIKVVRRSMRPEEWTDLRFGWLKRHIYSSKWEIENLEIRDARQVSEMQFEYYSEDYRPLKKGDMYFTPDGTAFIKAEVNIPDKFSGYTTRLTTNVNLGAEYNFLGNHFAVGALSHTRFYRNTIATEFTASFNVRPTNWMTFTASHTFLNGNTPGIFGAAINIHPRAINIFVGMD